MVRILFRMVFFNLSFRFLVSLLKTKKCKYTPVTSDVRPQTLKTEVGTGGLS